jgi:hypothetical protein
MNRYKKAFALIAMSANLGLCGLVGIAKNQEDKNQKPEPSITDIVNLEHNYDTSEPGWYLKHPFTTMEVSWDFNKDGILDTLKADIYEEMPSSEDNGFPVRAAVKYYKSENGKTAVGGKDAATIYIPAGLGFQFVVTDLRIDGKRDGYKDVLLMSNSGKPVNEEKIIAVFANDRQGNLSYRPFQKKQK